MRAFRSLLILSLVAGCATGVSDVADDERFVGDYRKGQQLVLVAPAFVRAQPPWSSRNVRTALPEAASACGNGAKFYLIPTTLAEYEANPKPFHHQSNPRGFNVFGVLRAGTTIKFAHADYVWARTKALSYSNCRRWRPTWNPHRHRSTKQSRGSEQIYD